MSVSLLVCLSPFPGEGEVNLSFRNSVKLYFSMDFFQTWLKHAEGKGEYPGRVKGGHAPPPRAYFDF